MNKKLSTALAVSLVLGTIVPASFASASSFVDIDGSYAKGAILALQEKGIINGVDDSHFDPQGSLTRSQFVKIIVKILDLPATATTSSFSDVNDWSVGYVEAAYKAGLANGVGNGQFDPNGIVTREQAAVMLVNALKTKATLDSTGTGTFGDMDQVSDWATSAIGLAQKYNLIKGDGVNFNPKGNATREQATILAENIIRTMDQMKKEYKITPENVTMNVGESKEFKVNGTGTQETVAWSATDHGTIDQNGKFTATKAGTATITALVNGIKTVTSNVTVNAPATGGGGSAPTPNNAPTVETQLPDLYAQRTSKVTIPQIASAFADADGDTLNISPNKGTITTNGTWEYTVPDDAIVGGTINITLTATDGRGGTVTETFNIVVPFQAHFVTTNNTGDHNGKVYEQHKLLKNVNGEESIDLNIANIKSITVLKPNQVTPTTLEIDTDPTLWFNVQNEIGLYIYTVIDKNDKPYQAVFEWAGSEPVVATFNDRQGEHDGKFYSEYKMGNLDLSSFDAMYQIKPNGEVSKLVANEDTTLWFNTGNPSGSYTFLVRQGGMWFETVITIPEVALSKAVSTSNFDNKDNLNAFMTALWGGEEGNTPSAEVTGITVNKVFSVNGNRLTIDGNKVTDGMKQFINTNYGGSSVPVKIAFSDSAPKDKVTDANWDNSYLVWVNLGDLVNTVTPVQVDMESGTRGTYTLDFHYDDPATVAPVISNVNLVSDNVDPSKAKIGNTVTLSFETTQEVTKLGNFKVNGSNPTTFKCESTLDGYKTTVTYVIEESDPLGAMTFQINVENSAGLFSTTIEETSDETSVTVVEDTPAQTTPAQSSPA